MYAEEKSGRKTYSKESEAVKQLAKLSDAKPAVDLTSLLARGNKAS